MNLSEALDIVISKTGVERYRHLCREDNPDVVTRDEYRALVMTLAADPDGLPQNPPLHHPPIMIHPGSFPTEAEYPPILTQAGNAASAAFRWAVGGFKTVPIGERARRRSICLACPSGLFDPVQRRCRACGCVASLKAWLHSEKCPRGHW